MIEGALGGSGGHLKHINEKYNPHGKEPDTW